MCFITPELAPTVYYSTYMGKTVIILTTEKNNLKIQAVIFDYIWYNLSII